MRRLNFVTLGVKDLFHSQKFYCSLFDWEPTSSSDESVCFFDMGGYILSLFSWEKLAEDAEVAPMGSGFSGITLAHNVRAKHEVKEFLEKAKACGGRIVKPAQDTFWGGHSGYFADPNGHLWEVAFNPFIPTKADGFLEIPK